MASATTLRSEFKVTLPSGRGATLFSKSTTATGSLSSDVQFQGSWVIEPETVEQIFLAPNTAVNPHDRLIIISNRDGMLGWASSVDTSAVGTIGIRANVPFVFGTGVMAGYATTVGSRADEATQLVTTIMFYNSSEDTAIVEMYGGT